jgi:hypothetical protein
MASRSLRLALASFFVLGVATSQSSSSRFWSESVKGPLSKPNADELYVNVYQDTQVPPREVPYLEGTVVYVVGTPSRGRLVRLAMDGSGTADAEILLDGQEWTLRTEPRRGTIVRFIGVIRDFGRTPFLVTFEPMEIVSGLDFTTTKPNKAHR